MGKIVRRFVQGAGIRNKSNDSEPEAAEEDESDESQSCIIQYVLFSPKTFRMDKE